MRKSIHIFLDKARELPKKTIHKVSKGKVKESGRESKREDIFIRSYCILCLDKF